MTTTAYPTAAAPSMSARYVHVDTNQIVDLMAAEGYLVDSVKHDKVTKRDPAFARHCVIFRAAPGNEIQVRGAVPQYLFTNSANGTTRATMVAGLYRFVCSNGLVVGSTFARDSVRHSGDPARQIIERVRALASNTGQVFQTIDKWAHTELTKDQRRELAVRAIKMRFAQNSGLFAPETLLNVRRGDDDAGDLWTTFNVIQENLMQGGLDGLSMNGRAVRTRTLTGIGATQKFNTELWNIAEEFAS